MREPHPNHHLCLGATFDELTEMKDEAYTRPEKYPFERFSILLCWTMRALEDAQTTIKEISTHDA